MLDPNICSDLAAKFFSRIPRVLGFSQLIWQGKSNDHLFNTAFDWIVDINGYAKIEAAVNPLFDLSNIAAIFWKPQMLRYDGFDYAAAFIKIEVEVMPFFRVR